MANVVLNSPHISLLSQCSSNSNQMDRSAVSGDGLLSLPRWDEHQQGRNHFLSLGEAPESIRTLFSLVLTWQSDILVWLVRLGFLLAWLDVFWFFFRLRVLHSLMVWLFFLQYLQHFSWTCDVRSSAVGVSAMRWFSRFTIVSGVSVVFRYRKQQNFDM